MNAKKLLAISAAIFFSLGLFSCGGGGGGGSGGVAGSITDETSARKFAWAVEIAVRGVVPASSTTSYVNTVKNGSVSGTAKLNGSTSYSYDSYNGRVTTTYNNVKIEFANYSADANFPSFSGTVYVTGTCIKQYGYSSTTYSGSWDLSGSSLTVGSSQADILIKWKREGLDWEAGVSSGGNTWYYSI